jgi:hypothetical protein
MLLNWGKIMDSYSPVIYRTTLIYIVPVIAKKAYGVWRYRFTHSALDGDEWSASPTDRYTTGEEPRE